MPWALVIACCIGMFAATASGSTRAPFLIEMAADFAVGLPAIANLFGMTAVFWGIASFLAGKAQTGGVAVSSLLPARPVLPRRWWQFP